MRFANILFLIAITVHCSGSGEAITKSETTTTTGSTNTNSQFLTIASSTPVHGSNNVGTNLLTISVTFSETLNATTVNSGSFTVSGGVTGTISAIGASAIFSVSSGLSANTLYSMTLTTAIKGTSGKTLSSNQILIFTTNNSPDILAPANVTTLAAGTVTPTSIALSWTAVGNDGNSGTATSYNLRYLSGAACPINATNFNSGTAVPGMPTPSPTGTVESKVVTGLTPSTQYCFALKVSDAIPNVSGLSNIVTQTTAFHLVDRGDGTIWDADTNLVWKKCAQGQNTDATCTGTPDRYLRFCDVADNRCNGGYSNSAILDGGGPSSVYNTCNALNSSPIGGFAGRTNWRVPISTELQTIAYGSTAPYINTTYFPSTGTTDGYWSASGYPPSASQAYILAMYTGNVVFNTKSVPTGVRCVSTGP